MIETGHLTPDRSIRDYPWLQEATGVDPNKLGAVMLSVRFPDDILERGYEVGALLPEDLHTSPNANRFWVKGDVIEDAHVSLLYGLVTPAYEQADTIYRLLTDWGRPDWLPVTSFEAFPSPFDDEPYACIVARVEDHNGSLASARALLQYLPHVDLFQKWKIHATVAYVEAGATERWLSFLNSRRSTVVEVPASDGVRSSLNLGSAK